MTQEVTYNAQGIAFTGHWFKRATIQRALLALRNLGRHLGERRHLLVGAHMIDKRAARRPV